MSNPPCARCGKQNPAEIHTCTPLALKLADVLETDWHHKRAEHPMLDAAAELRRLQAENEALRAEAGLYQALVAEAQDITAKVCAENETLRYEVDAIAAIKEERDALTTAIRKLHAAKGRYHTQLAACDLFDLVGLPNERPRK